MKKLLIAALATGAAFATTPAFGQATGEVLVNATVAPACGTGNHISGASAAPGWDQSDITIPNLTDGNGQFNTALEFTNRSFGNVWCNKAANVTIEVGALRNSSPIGTDTSSFTNRFDIEVVTDAGVYAGGTVDQLITTVGQASGVATLSGNSGQAFETGLQRFGGADSIRILPAVRASGGNYRPIAGTYQGYVRFTATTS